MRTLWRSSISILRQYPILWLPVLLAEFINFNLRWFTNSCRHWLIQRILPWLSEGHSVLSNGPVYGGLSQQVINKAILLASPLEWVSRFLSDLMLACALVATAAILYNIALSGRATLRDAAMPVRSSGSRIFLFSLILFGVNTVAGFLVGIIAPLVWSLHLPDLLDRSLPLSFSARSAVERMNLFPNMIGNIWALPITLCVVWVIAPLQIKLIQPPGSIPTPDQTKRARMAALVTALVATAVGLLVLLAESPLFPLQLPASNLTLHAIEAIASLIDHTPYVPFFIALYLIATPGDPRAESSKSPAPDDIAPEPIAPDALPD
jgi:hypothetical protein